MSVRVILTSARDDHRIGECRYASVPEIGSELMFLGREWERYGVVGIRHWPRHEGDIEIGDEPREACVEAFVEFGGELLSD